LRVITRLYAAPDSQAPPPPQRRSSLLASGLLASVLIGAALFINPLWLGLKDLAASGVDTSGYVETVLGSAGGRR